MTRELVLSVVLALTLLACGGDKGADSSTRRDTDRPTTGTGTGAPTGTGTGATGTGTGATGTGTGTTGTGTGATGTGTGAPTAFRDWFDGPVPRNVLMLSVDTTRRDHMGRYSRAPETAGLTPFLDQIAEQGVALDDLTQCSNWTMAGTACAIAGAGQLDRATARGMVPYLGGAGIAAPFPNGTPFLATWLADAGYRTMFVTSNDYFSGIYGSAQGHEKVENAFGQTAMTVSNRGRLLLEETLLETPDAPWFLHLHFFEPHHSYNPPEAYLEGIEDLPPIPYDLTNRVGHGQAVRDYESGTLSADDMQAIVDHMTLRYRGEIAWFDDQLSTFWAEYEAAGFLDDTLVVFWTDHGEAFWEHGEQLHAHSVHLDENAAIGLFWARNIVPMAVTEPTHITDLVPTILAMQGLPIPPEVTGYAVGTAPPGRVRSAFAGAFDGVVQMVERDGFKAHYLWKMGNGDAREPRWGGTGLAFYDRNTDPLETIDLYEPDDIHPELSSLWDELLPLIRAAEPYAAVDPRNVRPEWPEGLPN